MKGDKVMRLKESTYDILKWIAQVFLPAFITFLGVVLGISSKNYYNTKGDE